MLLDTFYADATNDPLKAFLIDEFGTTISYGRALSIITALLEDGEDSGETALIVCSNTTCFVLFFIACIQRFSSVCLLSHGDILERETLRGPSHRRLLFFPHDYEAIVSAAANRSREGSKTSPPHRTLANVAIFTSGTTATKKLLRYSAETLEARARSWATNFAPAATKRFLCTTTFAHSHGLNIHLLPSLVLGATLGIIDLRTMTTGRLQFLYNRVKPTVFTGLPSLFELLVGHNVDLDLRSAHLVLSGSESLHQELRGEIESRYGIQVIDQYGTAETGPLFLIDAVGSKRILRRALNGKNVAFVEPSADGVYRMTVTSDVMVDEIIGEAATIRKPRSLLVPDLVRIERGDACLLSRAEATSVTMGARTDAEAIERLIHRAEPHLSCLALLRKDGCFDVLYKVKAGDATAPHPAAIIALDQSIRSARRISGIPLTDSGKKIRSLRAMRGAYQVSQFDSPTDCADWLSAHMEMVPQYDGQLSHVVTATLDNPADFSSLTNRGIGFHNDAYDLARVPDFVALYCEQQASFGGVTSVADVAAALKQLPEEVRAFLFNRSFDFLTSPAKYYGYPGAGASAPIIGHDFLRFSEGYLKPLLKSDEERRHVSAFVEVLEKVKADFRLNMGDLLIIDNRRTLHARSAFSDERRLYRYWLTSA